MSTDNFQKYAKFYDALYQQKDYIAECNFIEDVVKRFGTSPVKSILDLGCGTGNHALKLAHKGFQVHGVDLSAEMLQQATSKAERIGLSKQVSWTQGDISNVDLGEKFDLVICMFAVISYLTSNKALSDFFKVVRKHLKPGGLFITDFWYGPAVLHDPPQPNRKTAKLEDGSITERMATPEHKVDKNLFKISYQLITYKNDKAIEEIQEDHFMRYLFLPELEYIAGLSSLAMLHSCGCCMLDQPTSIKNWTISTVFQG